MHPNGYTVGRIKTTCNLITFWYIGFPIGKAISYHLLSSAVRKYIPKLNGKLRPLGLPSIADKLLQTAVAKILGAIYEQDFLRSSFGYRPGTGAHQAIKELSARLRSGLYKKPILKAFSIISELLTRWNMSEKVSLANLSEGESFGEMGLIRGTGRSAGATALEETVALRIHYEKLYQAPSAATLYMVSLRIFYHYFVPNGTLRCFHYGTGRPNAIDWHLPFPPTWNPFRNRGQKGR